jgi:hypothetical protein
MLASQHHWLARVAAVTRAVWRLERPVPVPLPSLPFPLPLAPLPLDPLQVGVLTRNVTDDGRGKARSYVFAHKHEKESGRCVRASGC